MKIITIIFFLLFLVNSGYSQTEKLPSYFSNGETNQQKDIQLSNDADNTSGNQNHSSRDFNYSSIRLKQIGDENIANIDNKVGGGAQKVYQIGDKNNYQFLNYRNNLPINYGVLQLGNYNSLKVLGSNTLFSSMNIIQTGGAKMSVVNF